LRCVDAALAELDGSKHLIPVVVKHLRAIPVASVRANVKSYTQILRFEQELLNALPHDASETCVASSGIVARIQAHWKASRLSR
jgi:hypothetical protein